MHRLALTGLLLLATACASTEKLEARRLPLHVAVVPIGEAVVGTVVPGQIEGTETDVRLDLDSTSVTLDVARALERYCFERVTVLDAPSSSGPTEGAFERDLRVVDAARRASADWIIELSLRYDPEVYRRNASTFWLNFPLFLFASPSNWFVPDIGYYAEVELVARIYDLEALAAIDGSLGDPLAEVLAVDSRFDGTELSFMRRSDGTTDFLSAVLIPTGYLARESDSVSEAVHREVASELGLQLVRGLQSRRADLVLASAIAPVYLAPDDVRIEREGSALRVTGRALVRGSAPTGGIRSVSLDAGHERVTVAPTRAADGAPPGHDAFSFAAQVRAAPGARYLRLACEAGARDRWVRSYTFPIPPENAAPSSEGAERAASADGRPAAAEGGAR